MDFLWSESSWALFPFNYSWEMGTFVSICFLKEHRIAVPAQTTASGCFPS